LKATRGKAIKNAIKLFHELENLEVENVRVVLLSEGATQKNLISLCDRPEMAGVKLEFVEDMLVIIKVAGPQHQAACDEIKRQVGNYLAANAPPLICFGDADRPPEFMGMRPDILVCPRRCHRLNSVIQERGQQGFVSSLKI
jgi:hypothetical protein